MTPEDIASKLLMNLGECLNDEDSEFYIDLTEVNMTHFIHAMANILPTYIFNKYTGENKSQLEFNHVANQLCFQYCTRED